MAITKSICRFKRLNYRRSIFFLESLEHRCVPANIVDLGPGAAYALNNLGQVVGETVNPQDSNTTAFLYTGGHVDLLSSMSGASHGSIAYDINNQGQVVGSKLIANAFSYKNGNAVDLGELPLSINTIATGVNDNGVIVGWALNPGSLSYTAFKYDSTGISQVLPSRDPIGLLSQAEDINNSGQIIGYYSPEGGGAIHAFVSNNGTLTDLGAPQGYKTSFANAINDSGMIVGYATMDVSGIGFGQAFVYETGTFKMLGTLGGTYSEADGINNIGEIVGMASTTDGPMHAFVYQDGVMIDLNSLLPPDSGWQLISAADINEKGQIVGYGLLNGAKHAFLLDTSTSIPQITLGSLGILDTNSVSLSFDISKAAATGIMHFTFYQSDSANIDGSSISLGQYDVDTASDSQLSSVGMHDLTVSLDAPISLGMTGQYVIAVVTVDSPQRIDPMSVVKTSATIGYIKPLSLQRALLPRPEPGVVFSYEASGSIVKDVDADFYWATGPTAADITGPAPAYVYEINRAAVESAGQYGPIYLPMSAFSAPPKGALYLIMDIEGEILNLKRSIDLNEFYSLYDAAGFTSASVPKGKRNIERNDVVTVDQPLTDAQKKGLADLLNFIQSDASIDLSSDVRFAAYMLATTKRETGGAYVPNEEIGSIRYFRQYDPPTIKAARLGNTKKGDGYTFRGRGYTHVTGRRNYMKLSYVFHVNAVDDPGLESRDRQFAYNSMMYGMVNGIFTGLKIGRFISPDKTDYVDARAVINGRDRANLIAGYAVKFESILDRSFLP